MRGVAAFRSSLYEAEGIVLALAPDLRHGGLWRRRQAVVAALLARLGRPLGVFITAWNPGGRRAPVGRNRRRMAQLLTQLRAFPLLHGMGRACRPHPWGEEHLLVAMPQERGRGVARRFGQAAIVSLHRFGPPRLVLLGNGAAIAVVNRPQSPSP